MKDKNNTDDTSKKHLPLFGVGPVIVYGQFFITGMAIVLSYIFDYIWFLYGLKCKDEVKAI